MADKSSVTHHKRIIRALNEELEDLRVDAEALERLRNSGHVFDAIFFYLTLPHLSEAERDSLRECLSDLARGGGQ